MSPGPRNALCGALLLLLLAGSGVHASEVGLNIFPKLSRGSREHGLRSEVHRIHAIVALSACRW